MTKKQLLNKWRNEAIDAAGHDYWMEPCYEIDLAASNVDIENLAAYSRGQWEATDHFQILYGGPMYHDALDFLASLGDNRHPDTEDIIELKMDLIDAFWESWEDEIGAAEIIAHLREDQPKRLADKMLHLLEIVTVDGESKISFTAEAISQQSVEYHTLSHWMSSIHADPDFLFDQAFYMLDYVASSGLDDLDAGLPDADIYIVNLTHWLAGNIFNLNYITEVLEIATGIDNGSELLQRAQYLAIRNIWMSLAKVLEEMLQ